MNQKDIRTLLEQGYDRERWKKLVTALFPGRDVFANALPYEPESQEDRKHVQRIYQFGEAKLKDGELIGLYEAHLQASVDLARNRASVRKAVEKLVKWGGLSGALISFVDPGKGIWRFSFYSNTLSAEGTWESAHRKRYTYLLGEGEKCRTAAEQFEILTNKAGQVTLKDLLDAFSVEKVSKAFFREYKEHYQDFVQHLTGKRMVKKAGKWEEKVMHPPSPKLAAYFNGNEKDARDFCKKLMGRLVFLYFLQKKRWLGASSTAYLDGDPDFVFGLFRAQGGDAFYPNVLVPLFFETLNAERAGDDYRMPDKANRKVPFLNGGLFDMDVLDRRTRLLTFPPELFSNPAKADEEKERGFLDFLNAYNFTVHEAGPEEQTLAVDPEMLGHIFENLLEDNKDKGAFYTPKEIVHYMCQESLVQYLKNYLVRARGEEVKKQGSDGLEDHLRRFLQHGEWAALSPYSGVLLKALRDVKVCDPAIGSGAFPMGILHEIFQCVERIHDLSPDETESIWELSEWNPAEVKLRIIQHSIYGVDIERGAVDIARLRFWLSIIVDERTPRTLPNLDYKIVVGDSLLGRFNKEVLHIDWELKGTSAKELEIQETVKELGRKSALFFRDQPMAKKEKLAKDIRALKIDLLTQQLEVNRLKYEAESARMGKLFGPSKKDEVYALEVKGRLAEFERALKNLGALAKDKDKALDCFDWQLDFPEVLNEHVNDDPGFDIVIGNPPYVRQEVIKSLKADLAKAYPETFVSTADLFVYFMHLGHAILRKQGTFCYIVSNKWMRAGYGAKLKKYLADQTLHQLLDFGEQPVFEATAYTCILLSERRKAEAEHAVRTWAFNDLPFTDLTQFVQHNAHHQPQTTFIEADYLIGNATMVEVVMKLKRTGTPLGMYLNGGIYYGIKTGYNQAFVIDRETRDELIRRDRRSASVIKPFLAGRDLKRYEPIETQRYLIFIPWHFPLHEDESISGASAEAERAFSKGYPAVFAHLSEHKQSLSDRNVDEAGVRYEWYALQRCAATYFKEFDAPKLVVPAFLNRPAFVLDTGGHYSNDKTTIVCSSDKWLMGVLNSGVVGFFISQIANTKQGGYYEYKPVYLEQIPIVRPYGILTKRLEALVEKRLAVAAGPAATALEAEIDVLVCKLYGLSWEQAKVVDPQLALSKEAYEAIELPPADEPSGNGVSEPGVTGLTDEGTLFGQPLEELPVKVKREPPSERPTPIAHTEREEVLQTIRKVFGSGGSRDKEIALRDIATELGHQRLGSKIRAVLETDLLTAVRRGILENTGGQYRLLARSVEDYDRDLLKDSFLSAIGRTWVERDEAIRLLARWLGFARTSEGMVEVGKSVINGLIRTGELEREGAERIRKA